MPAIFDSPRQSPKSHPYYVRYVNNRPVAYRGLEDVLFNEGKVYDYGSEQFVPIDGLRKE